MKKFILVFSLLAALSSCETKPVKGFLVCKEYVPGHMDDEHAKTVQEAYIPIPVPFYMLQDEPEYVPSVWYFYVANKDGVGRFKVDSLTYTRHKVGERIVINQ